VRLHSFSIRKHCSKLTLLSTCRGNLSTKSLASIVDPRSIVQDSEYIETHLVAVPSQLVKDFLKTYETVAPMVVPRSAQLLAEDSEFSLYAVTGFKKHSVEFVHKCREQKWIPRDFKYVEGGKEEERKEVERVGGDERKLWGETLRLGRTAWSEAVMVWIHVLVLRVFVETVLRYGLPLDFVCGLVRVCFSSGLSYSLLLMKSLTLLVCTRPRPRSTQTRPKPTLRRSTHIWRAMRLDETRRAV
jgi:V-type H+-transporting ATPase subunit C